MNCNVCGKPNATGARSCASCGATFAARCPVCGAEVQAQARFCAACGQNLAPAAAVTQSAEEPTGRLGGERRQVTILFADFSGYTAYSTTVDPEDLHDTMNSIWARVDAYILAHGGTPEKHSGDAVMAVFGARRAREEDPAEAVRAALAIQAWLKEAKPEEKRLSLQMRIGVHTGLVVVGNSEKTGEFLATGDAINLASRLEQSAPPGGVLISRETHRHVYGLFEAQAQPPLQVKGLAEPVETFLILKARPRSLAMQFRGIEGVQTDMIGRQKQLDGLLGAFEGALKGGRLQFTVLASEAGIGKSRLLSEFRKRADVLPYFFRFFSGRTTSGSAVPPFAVIRDFFSTRFEIHESDPAAVAREKFENGVKLLLARPPGGEIWTGDELAQNTQLIGQLLGLDYSASPHLRDLFGDAEQFRRLAFQSFIRLMTAICTSPALDQPPEARGALMLLEDLHWCDDSSLELLEHLICNCGDIPLMIVCTARPSFFERRPDWGQGLRNLTRLDLEPLSESESQALVETILSKAPEIPPALRELVTAGAEGNPFYIEEKIKMLMDQKVILPQADQWRFEMSRMSATLPSTLTGVLQARLDGLAPVERALLQRASVVGRVFWDSAVEQMGLEGAGAEGVLSKQEIIRTLESLRRKELVYRREASSFAGSEEYTFKHELLRNVAYESLLKKSRRQHHARVAGWLKEQVGDRIQEFAALVASHFENASQLAEAAEWHGRAGQQARLGYASAIAAEHFKKALSLLPAERAEEREFQKLQMEWREGLGESLVVLLRSPEALESFEAMRDLARRLSDPVGEARAWNGTANLHERNGDNRASLQCAERAQELARQSGEAGGAERIRALNLIGWAYYRMGDAPAKVLELGSATLKLCHEQGDRMGSVISYKLLGVANLQLDQCDEAERYFKLAQDISAELGYRRGVAAMWSNRGECARNVGDFARALSCYEEALVRAREMGQHDIELIYLTNLAGARVGLGQFAEAETDFRQVLSQTTTPNSCSLPEAFANLTEACLGQGKIAEAVKTAQQGLALAKESESSLYLGFAWRALGRAGARAHASEIVPTECFEQSLKVFRLINAQGEQARTLRAWGEHELDQGRADAGRRRLAEAQEIFSRLDFKFEIEATEALARQRGGPA